MNNLFVYCEIEDGIVTDVSLELLTKGRSLANQLDYQLEAVVVGTGLKDTEKQILPYGVNKLHVFDGEGLYPYTSLPHTSVLVNLFREEQPQICLMDATVIGHDLGPRVSSALTSGLTADCISPEIDDYGDKKEGKVYRNLLYQIRPTFGGNIVATIVNPEHRPQMATVRKSVMKKATLSADYKGEIIKHDVKKYVADTDYVVKVIEHYVEKAKNNLKGSPIIIAGGYSVDSRENFNLLSDLIKVLNAGVGASRAAVDTGFVDHDRQIGQIGVTVRPKPYIACGISGQIQHTAGMQESGIIISINNDPLAPTNTIADYMINGTIEEVVPKMTKYYKQNSKQEVANFYLDTLELKHYLNHPLMRRVVELKERNHTDKDKSDYAPVDFEDTMDSYDKVLEIIGEICGDIITPNAEGVDHEGSVCADNRITYASGTTQNLDAYRKAGLMGMATPRRFGGLNFLITPYIMATDIVSRSDAGFENLWGLQDCAETIYEFINEEQKQCYITRICQGETISMDLTEPDAGSGLQSVMLRAIYSEEDQYWYLNGAKRFITNGDTDIHLTLARSEEGTHDGRDLFTFIYDKRNDGVNIRRIEDKMGIKGSPICGLVYKSAKAELCGDRKPGLVKYVMALMNGARLGIATQSTGLSQAAYNEALAYAKNHKQFGKTIVEFPAVAEILSLMKAKLDASRSLLYKTARFVDIYKALDDIAKERKLTPEEHAEQKTFTKLADAFTPLGKGMSSEFTNQNVHDCIQIHGGSGFMKDYACERIYRDSRITSVYEGTTQLQVVAAIRYVTTGAYLVRIQECENMPVAPKLEGLQNRLKGMAGKHAACVTQITEAKNREPLDSRARRLVEMVAHIIMGHLTVQDASKSDMFSESAQVYVRYAEAEVEKYINFIRKFDKDDLAYCGK